MQPSSVALMFYYSISTWCRTDIVEQVKLETYMEVTMKKTSPKSYVSGNMLIKRDIFAEMSANASYSKSIISISQGYNLDVFFV